MTTEDSPNATSEGAKSRPQGGGWKRTHSEAAATALATYLGTLAVPGSAGAAAAAAASSYALTGLDALRHMWTERAKQNGARVLDVASERLGVNPEELITSISGNPEFERLAAMAVGAGSATVLEEKIKALGRALAEGILAEDDAKLDETALILAALAEMEAPHVKLLDLMAATRYETPHFSELAYPHYDMDSLWRSMPGFGACLTAVHGTLVRHGLIREIPFDMNKLFGDFRTYMNSGHKMANLPRSIVFNRSQWVITELGVAVHRHLLTVGRAASNAESSSPDGGG